jgi:hypothetical protein
MLSSLLAAFNRRRSPSVQSEVTPQPPLCDFGGRQTARVESPRLPGFGGRISFVSHTTADTDSTMAKIATMIEAAYIGICRA